MPDLKSIPDDTKWMLAARCAASLPAMYDVVFRPVAGERYDELEQEIWIELSKLSFDIARSLKLPVKNAQEIAESLRTVYTILFGPEYKAEAIEVGEDGSVIVVRHCPFLRPGGGGSQDGVFHRCMVFSLSSQKGFNPKYASRFVRAMCMGDRQCEIRVEPDKEQGKPGEKKDTK